MCQSDPTFAIYMTVTVQYFAYIDAYLSCRCATPNDTPLFNVLGLKGVIEFSKG